MRPIRAVTRRTPAERRVLASAAVLVPTLRAALWLLPFPTVLRVVDRLSRLDGPPRTAPGPDEIARAVRSVGKRVLRRKPCLTQALAGLAMLRRAGYPARLHIGVANGGFRPRAHAWLELDGSVLLGGASAPDRYVPLFTMCADGRTIGAVDRAVASRGGRP